jgi:hypothetical protein
MTATSMPPSNLSSDLDVGRLIADMWVYWPIYGR